MSHSVTVWDRNTPPAGIKDHVLCWQSHAQSPAITSIPRHLESNADRLKAKYIAFSHDLGESRIAGKRVVEHLDAGDGFSHWWMNRLSENSPFKSSRVYDCLRLMALEEMLHEINPAQLVLDSSDRDLALAINRLCQNLQIEFAWRESSKRPKWSIRRIYEALPHSLQGLISLRHLVVQWPLRRLRPLRWFSGDDAIFFCSYFFNLDTASCSKGKFHSRQWEALPRYLHNSGKRTNWIHHFLRTPGMPDAGTSLGWLQQFNHDPRAQGCHAFLETYLSWRIALGALKNWLWLHIVAWRLRNIGNAFTPKKSAAWLWPLLRDDWKISLLGTTSMSNCLWVELFDAALKDAPHQKVGLYLWENQGWECALVHAWRKHGHGEIIGVPHTTVPFWYLNIYDDPRVFVPTHHCPKPLPDYLAANGPMAWNALVQWGYPANRLLEVEALRFQYLLSHRTLQPNRPDRHRLPDGGQTAGEPKTVLILGDYTLAQTDKMLQCIAAALAMIHVKVSLTLKPHPASRIDADSYPDLSLTLTNRPLAEIMQDFDLAFSSNTTSAALDAYLACLPVVVFLEDADFNHSPLRGVEGVRFVGTAEEMAVALRSSQRSGKASVNNDFFWLDGDMPRWQRLINDDGRRV